ncbi:MAG: YggT family protein [Candidatus Paracaedibacter sp.]|jgi:YggT family protein
MDIILVPLISVIITALKAYWWAIVIYVLIGWLEQFGVINRYNNFVYGIHTFLFRIVEPALHPLRQLLPKMEGVDLSPAVLILVIYLVELMLIQLRIKFPL